MRIFPNPISNNKAIVELEMDVREPIDFKLYDVLGHLVYTKRTNQSLFEISPQNLSKGMYIFSIESNDIQIGKGKVIFK